MTDFDRFPVAFPKRTIGTNDEENVSPARVFGILKGRGYGFGAHSGFALVLCRKANVRKTDGMPTYVPFGMGISKRDLSNIIVTSQTAQIAADRIEAIVRGESTDSFQGDAVTRRAAGISLDDVDRRVAEGVQKALAALGLKPPAPTAPEPVPITAAPQIEPGFRPLLAEDSIMPECAGVTETPRPPREKKKRGWPKGKLRGPRKPKTVEPPAE
jgi:hypothetical protein